MVVSGLTAHMLNYSQAVIRNSDFQVNGNVLTFAGPGKVQLQTLWLMLGSSTQVSNANFLLCRLY